MIDFSSLLPNELEQSKLQSTFEPVINQVVRDANYDNSVSEWLWNQQPLDIVPDKHKTFVYLITNKLTGKRYIGFKVFVTKKQRVVKRKKTRVETESDWKDYWSSSELLNHDVKKFGPGNFIREIVCMTVNKSVGKYIEAQLHFDRKVLTDNKDHYYNGIVNLRINQHTLKQISDIEWCSKPLLGDILARDQFGIKDL